MKNLLFFPLLLILFALNACQTDRSYTPTELPFATDPSVLRGDWLGTIQNVPAEQDVTLELANLVAACLNAKENKCFSYTFGGEVSVGGSDFVSISGQVDSGDNYIYTLRTPPRSMSFEASFQLDGVQWSLFGTYRTSYYYTPPENEMPFYEGNVVKGTERRGIFKLEPRP